MKRLRDLTAVLGMVALTACNNASIAVSYTHLAGIVQLLAGAVTGTSGGPGQAADIKRIHRTNGLWLGGFTLGQQLCRYRPQAGRGFEIGRAHV